jgi:spore coat protein U-like protein
MINKGSLASGIALLWLVAMAVTPMRAGAASTASRSFTVSVIVIQAECIVSATPARLAEARSPVVSVNCVAPVPYNIGLSGGAVTASQGYSLRAVSGETARRGESIGVGVAEPAAHTFSVVGPAQDGLGADTITVTITY